MNIIARAIMPNGDLWFLKESGSRDWQGTPLGWQVEGQDVDNNPLVGFVSLNKKDAVNWFNQKTENNLCRIWKQ